MVALTYGDASAVSAKPATEAAVPRKRWLSRFMDALMEARMQQAQREIRLYSRMAPLAAPSDTATTAETNSPRGGW